MNGAVPIFADIDKDIFCIDPASVASRITPRTKAIMVVNLFGQGADFSALLPLAKKHGLAVIEDNAQSPGATWRGADLGTVGDIGIFSLNLHKAIQTGEGGVLVTNMIHTRLARSSAAITERRSLGRHAGLQRRTDIRE